MILIAALFAAALVWVVLNKILPFASSILMELSTTYLPEGVAVVVNVFVSAGVLVLCIAATVQTFLMIMEDPETTNA